MTAARCTAADSAAASSRLLFIVAIACCSLAAEAAHSDGARKPRDGAAIYNHYCSVCHGESGDGRSRARASLVPPPRDFTDPAIAARLTREYMIAIVREGRPGTAMVGWSTQLGQSETEAVVDYVRNTFMRSALDPTLARGRALYSHACAHCHGSRGQGVPGTGKASRAFSAARPALTRERIVAAMAREPHGGGPSRLPAQDIHAVVEYVRTALVAASSAISGREAR